MKVFALPLLSALGLASAGFGPGWVNAKTALAAAAIVRNDAAGDQDAERKDEGAIAVAIAGDHDELLGAVGVLLFVFAGCGFMALCLLAGTATIMASQVAAVVPVVWDSQAVLVSGVAWWTGLAAALTGLAFWIIRSEARRPLMPWAIVDCALIAVLIVVVLLFAF